MWIYLSTIVSYIIFFSPYVPIFRRPGAATAMSRRAVGPGGTAHGGLREFQGPKRFRWKTRED